MRFTLFDKFLLVLLLLVTICIAAVFIGSAMNLVSEEMITGVVSVLFNGMTENRLIMGGIGLVLLVIALRMFIAMGKKREHTAPAPTSTLLASGENGSAYITLAAIDSLVQRFVRANQRVKECESRISCSEQGVGIALRLSVLPDTVIPELTAQLQSSLKEHIESMCGVKVTGVDILLMPMAQPKVPKSI